MFILSITPPPPGGTPYSGLYREAPPDRVPFFKLAVYKRVGKIAILLNERVTKSAAKWKKWWQKVKYMPHFGRNDYATESE